MLTTFKRLIIPVLITCFSNPLFSKNLEAYFNYSVFNTPAKGPYVETYLSIIGSSVTSKPFGNNKFKGEVSITMLFKQGDMIRDFKKYELSSPIGNSIILPNFIDQQRISLPNGTYQVELQIADKNSADTAFVLNEEIIINYNDNDISISPIQLIESYTPTIKENALSKSGYDLVPYVASFYPKSMNKLAFYAEIYNTEKVLGKDEKYLVNYYIESFESRVKMRDLSSFARKNAETVTVILGEFPIDKLPSGNYNMVVEAKNKNNELLAQKKMFFQRSNKEVPLDMKDLGSINIANTFVADIPEDTLKEYIAMLRPISSSSEQVYASNLIKSSDLLLKQQYFFNFWYTRKPVDPNAAWQPYYDQVQKVNAQYSTKIKKGYESDRGVTYLKYGQPNTVTPMYHEPSAYPYEIWHYYKIANFSNKKFIFYNPDLVTNDFEMLHSDMFGEVNNPRWQVMLHKRNTPITDIDRETVDPNVGSDSENLFRSPR